MSSALPRQRCQETMQVVLRLILEFEDLVEGVVKKAIDDFSAVVDHQLLEEHLDRGLLAIVIQAGPQSRKVAEA
jgi:uncharacterized protein YkvS